MLPRREGDGLAGDKEFEMHLNTMLSYVQSTFKARHQVVVLLGVYESPKLLISLGIRPEAQ